jgi:oligopeptide/dipeptide ABC transporter ATP-binding protein
MYLGKVVELAESNEIYRNPLHPYTQALIRSAPASTPALARAKEGNSIEGDIPSPISPPPGCRFHTRCPRATPRCRQEEPPLVDTGAGHKAACHLLSF